MDSTSDGNGLFTYTFRRGNVPFVWGMSTNSGAIAVQSYGILEIQEPPGWTHSVSPSGRIIWSMTNGIVFLEDPVTFSVRSCLAVTANYDQRISWPLPPPPYPVGTITGTIYELPDHFPWAVGYQHFVFVGPARPILSIARNGGDIVLSWPTLEQRCNLEAADGPQPQTTWTAITNTPVIVATNFTVTLSATNSPKFFRLVTPAVQLP